MLRCIVFLQSFTQKNVSFMTGYPLRQLHEPLSLTFTRVKKYSTANLVKIYYSVISVTIYISITVTIYISITVTIYISITVTIYISMNY